MATKKVLKQDVKIKKGNAAFDKMTKAEKRVAICKDVLKHLSSDKIKAKTGYYIHHGALVTKMIKLGDKDKREQLQTLLAPATVTCKVCAKGAMFVADIIKNNDYEVGFNLPIPNDNYSIVRRLEKYFYSNQLNLIEKAFEMYSVGEDHQDIFTKAIQFGRQYKTDKDRLIAIMENVIKNKGTFKP